MSESCCNVWGAVPIIWECGDDFPTSAALALYSCKYGTRFVYKMVRYCLRWFAWWAILAPTKIDFVDWSLTVCLYYTRMGDFGLFLAKQQKRKARERDELANIRRKPVSRTLNLIYARWNWRRVRGGTGTAPTCDHGFCLEDRVKPPTIRARKYLILTNRPSTQCQTPARQHHE